MFRGMSIRWRLAGSFFLIILLLIFLTGLYLLERTEASYVSSVSADLLQGANAAASAVRAVEPANLPSLITRVGRALHQRITVVAADGSVLADSEQDFRKMANHSDRPEVRQALLTGFGSATRYSATLKSDMLYVASRHEMRGGVYVVRAAEPLSGLEAELSAIKRTFALAGLAALLLAALLSIRLASGITGPIQDISQAAERLAGGDLTARAPASPKPRGEVASLAQTFNSMAEELQNTIRAITEQKARMQAVFDNTDDGLILVGSGGEIQMLNQAACATLGIDGAAAVGRTIIEGTLSHDLAELTARVMNTNAPAALDISLPNAPQVAIDAYVAPVSPAEEGGALVVLHDVTESKRLDQVRRDFVANVSHEIRTPLASIKAMAETILLRGKDDPSVPAQFAESIVKETDRMLLMAEELLDLARIESEQLALNREDLDLSRLIEEIFESLRPAAEARSVSLSADNPDVGGISADREMVSQILINLVDNAIKFSREGGNVTVLAARRDKQVEISVHDNGIGIPEDDLPRVFERFYRVDKARSRESGGTGLGLAIVRHLAELMGGSVAVVSRPDEETIFTVSLPA